MSYDPRLAKIVGRPRRKLRSWYRCPRCLGSAFSQKRTSCEKCGLRMLTDREYAALRGAKTNPPSRQLRIGTKIELKHTRSRRVARKIALDHLKEFPDYYSRLVKMERAAKRYWRRRRGRNPDVAAIAQTAGTGALTSLGMKALVSLGLLGVAAVRGGAKKLHKHVKRRLRRHGRARAKRRAATRRSQRRRGSRSRRRRRL